ncbi:hypothetical protein [Pseudarthrobacter sp. W1I19]|uniref:hypothetical protein n=1 Tax=Pseudarthrobacter sp. W1I19 TaxID=3042288 RepID=UPI0027D7CDCD|nr:hypothetical protein [Pseudarthrobacter sp. W1I19]
MDDYLVSEKLSAVPLHTRSTHDGEGVRTGDMKQRFIVAGQKPGELPKEKSRRMGSCGELSHQSKGSDPGSQGYVIGNLRHPDSPAWRLQALVTEPTSAYSGVDRFLEGERQGRQLFG